MKTWWLPVLLALFSLTAGCGGSGGADGDTGTDGDTETDGDAIIDGDTQESPEGDTDETVCVDGEDCDVIFHCEGYCCFQGDVYLFDTVSSGCSVSCVPTLIEDCDSGEPCVSCGNGQAFCGTDNSCDGDGDDTGGCQPLCDYIAHQYCGTDEQCHEVRCVLCESDAGCGANERCLEVTFNDNSSADICSAWCAGDADCPSGFACLMTVNQCYPLALCGSAADGDRDRDHDPDGDAAEVDAADYGERVDEEWDAELDGIDDESEDGDTAIDGETEADDDIAGEADPDTETDVEQACRPHASSACNTGDVYWYDSCGNREEKKEECDDCVCTDDACIQDAQRSSECSDDDVYYYDCHGERAAMKDECGTAGCCNGECMSQAFPCCSGICKDPETGFQWQQTPTGGTMVWSDAITHCQGLNLSGTGWRLPNISELRSLVRNCAPIETNGECPVVDVCTPCGTETACIATSCLTDACDPSSCDDNGGPTGCFWPPELIGTCFRYWSLSEREDNPLYAWDVDFKDGFVSHMYVEIPLYYVRCVR